MAKKASVLVSVDLALSPEQVESVVSSVEGDGTQSYKVSVMALKLLESFTEGGQMLEPRTVRQLEEANGGQFSEEVLIEKFESGMGKQGGARVVMIPIDPVHEPALMEVARSNGMPSAEALMRRDIEDLWDQGHFYAAVPQPKRVLMSDNDYVALKGILGADFDNGTELAAMVMKHVNENTGLFAGRE